MLIRDDMLLLCVTFLAPFLLCSASVVDGASMMRHRAINGPKPSWAVRRPKQTHSVSIDSDGLWDEGSRLMRGSKLMGSERKVGVAPPVIKSKMTRNVHTSESNRKLENPDDKADTTVTNAAAEEAGDTSSDQATQTTGSVDDEVKAQADADKEKADDDAASGDDRSNIAEALASTWSRAGALFQSADTPVTPADGAIVVAATTLPTRHDRLLNLLGLVGQQASGRLIHFYLAVPLTFNGQAVDFDATKFVQDSKSSSSPNVTVEVERVEDIGPATRVYGAVKYGSSHPVVLIDDDSFGLNVGDLVDTYEKSGDAPHTIVAESVLHLPPKTKCVTRQETVGGPEDFAFGEAYAGMLFPPGFMKEDFVVWLKTLPDFCKVSDDYLYGVWAHRHGYKVIASHSSRALLEMRNPDPHTSDKLAGDDSCISCPGGGFCTGNTIHYERCRKHLADNKL